MAAGIVLAAAGVETIVAHIDEPLPTVPAAALLGGVALYLLGHVALRLRNTRTLNYQRLGLAVVLLALVPVATLLPSLVALAGVTGLFWLLIGFETQRYGERRTRLRHDHLHPGG
jgi:low temperature requirement protein LtrA